MASGTENDEKPRTTNKTKNRRDKFCVSFVSSPAVVTAVAPGACDPECPPIVETVAAPAAVQREVEQVVRMPGAPGPTRRSDLSQG